MTAAFVRHKSPSWYESSARDRVRLLLDAGSFKEFIGPEQREMSPHLAIFDLPKQFDDGIESFSVKVQPLVEATARLVENSEIVPCVGYVL